MNSIAPKMVHALQERQFRRLVRERVPSTPGRSIDRAVDYFVRSRPLDLAAVAECAELARAHATVYEYDPAEATVDFPLIPDFLIERDRLVEMMAPAVTRARQELFGATSPPFLGAPEKAGEWIEAEAAKQELSPSDDDRILAKMLQREIDERMKQCALLLRQALVLTQSDRRLSYPASSGLRDVSVVPGSPLDSLEVATRKLSEWTGFSEAAVVLLILTGEEPILRPVTVRFEDRFPPPILATAPMLRRVVVTLYGRDLTFPQLRKLYREVRSTLGIVRKKRRSEQDRVLMKTVNGVGGPPARPTSPVFWKPVLETWNREYPKWRVRHWRSLAKRYAKAMPGVGKDSAPVGAGDRVEIRVTGTGIRMDLGELAARKRTQEFKKARKTARAIDRFVSTLANQAADAGRRLQHADHNPPHRPGSLRRRRRCR